MMAALGSRGQSFLCLPPRHCTCSPPPHLSFSLTMSHLSWSLPSESEPICPYCQHAPSGVGISASVPPPTKKSEECGGEGSGDVLHTVPEFQLHHLHSQLLTVGPKKSPT